MLLFISFYGMQSYIFFFIPPNAFYNGVYLNSFANQGDSFVIRGLQRGLVEFEILKYEGYELLQFSVLPLCFARGIGRQGGRGVE